MAVPAAPNSASGEGRRTQMKARATATLLAAAAAARAIDPPSITPKPRTASSRRRGRVLTKPPSMRASLVVAVALGRTPSRVEQGADEDVRSRANAEGPVAAKPTARVL